MIKVLVTGANGQLGRTIRELYSNNKIGLNFTFVSKMELDISNKEKLQTFFKHRYFDYCINCAAYTNVEQAEKTPEIAFKINSEGVKFLAESCKVNNLVLIHISTDYVFDGEKDTAYTIKDTPNPINKYGNSKLLGEQYIQEILEEYLIIRTSWLYSKKHGKNFYKTILQKAETEKELFITDEQKGCPTDTVNLATFIVNFINVNDNYRGIYHFCDEKIMTWYDFAKEILKENNLLDKIILVKAKKYITFAKRPKSSILLNKK